MYSIPFETEKLLQAGILNNPLIQNLPEKAQQYAAKIKFRGSDSPSMPINWRFAESISSIKALEAITLMDLLEQKYGTEVNEVEINTDHAQLFVMSTLLWMIDPEDGKLTAAGAVTNPSGAKQLAKYFPSFDKHRQMATYHRDSCTNIYQTKDGRYFHLHGSMNPDLSLDTIGLPREMDHANVEDSWKTYIDKIRQFDSQELQELVSDVGKQAGTICWTPDEYRQSEHGKANAHIGLYQIREQQDSSPPTWWPETPLTSAKRPLAGLKVVDITRVIAAPAITRGLAEMGASVMRITSPNLTDYSSLHCDLNWGKWNCYLDFTNEDDRKRLHALLVEADVVVSGYRPYVLDKWGLGEQDILNIAKERNRGIIYVRENCYGWDGPWAGRSGWQQISDACCGVSIEFGRAMGYDEAVTPILPNSDYCCGVSGIAATLRALTLRGKNGGSYSIDVALNYYSRWLVDHCGTYPQEVWENVWSKNGRPVFRHYHNMMNAIPKFVGLLKHSSNDILFRPEFFEDRECKSIGKKIRTVRPILKFSGEEVDLGYDIGTRSNGVDKPYWPKDLSVEIVN